jgi:hypothetical protein
MLGLFIASLVWSAQTTGALATAALSPGTQHIAMIIGMLPSVSGTDGEAAARKQQQMEKLVAAGLDIDSQQRGLRDLMAETDGEATAQTAK